ncbi:uncharacterized protein LOC117179921 [Belonocnema kinseyi]|uniref:uncharacterized protein LOC117179921 n=1 Tax=Belonocnema kinseyi TaxID=2817044 RepID=UPI00143DF97B|nr:uncharacterized protein LOC117179921 [Belonocnema kinseyi]
MGEFGKKSSSDNTPSEKPPSSQAKCPDTIEPKKVSEFGNNFYSQLNSIIEKLKSTFKKFLSTDLKRPITSDLLNGISATEKVIKNFYGQVVQKVTEFAENDILKFKNMSKEETERTRKILLQYAADMQKISNEKLKQLMAANVRLQKKMLKREELHAIAKFFDMKMIEVKKLTEELCSSLSKKETAPFVKDFQKMMETQSIAVKSSLDSFLVAAKLSGKTSKNSGQL